MEDSRRALDSEIREAEKRAGVKRQRSPIAAGSSLNGVVIDLTLDED